MPSASLLAVHNLQVIRVDPQLILVGVRHVRTSIEAMDSAAYLYRTSRR